LICGWFVRQNPHDGRIRSHLFTVRLWLEDLGDGRTERRGKMKHILSGEVRYFRDWPTLIALLQALLAEAEKSLDTHNSDSL